ncbi:MAG: MlaD family protein [Proteobacteria bacterium]|jgi:phospholipid/cholesterol/gamma-HCH transport system substrate-binding protein|nr:MlaD family protein [Pseudomonadota bacterium]
MISRAEKIRLGVFLIVAGALAVGAFVVLAGFRLTEKSDRYTVRFIESVSGLEVGAQVKYNGVRVGQITDIRIDAKNIDSVVTVLELREGTPVKKDTTAVMVSMGITGLKFVELTGGTKKADLLPVGSEIKAGQSFMGSLEGKAQDIAVKMEIALNKINAVLTDENIRGVREIIANVATLSGDLSMLVQENDTKVTALIENAEAASADLKEGLASANRSAERLEEVMTEAQPEVRKILTNAADATESFKRVASSLSRVDKILADINVTLDSFNEQVKAAEIGKISKGAQETVAEAEAAIKGVRQLVEASRGDIYASARSLRRTMQNLEELTADLKKQPSLIINSKAPKERDPKKDK